MVAAQMLLHDRHSVHPCTSNLQAGDCSLQRRHSRHPCRSSKSIQEIEGILSSKIVSRPTGIPRDSLNANGKTEKLGPFCVVTFVGKPQDPGEGTLNPTSPDQGERPQAIAAGEGDARSAPPRQYGNVGVFAPATLSCLTQTPEAHTVHKTRAYGGWSRAIAKSNLPSPCLRLVLNTNHA